MFSDNLNKIFEMRRATFHLTSKDRKEYGIAEFKSKEHFLEWRMLMMKRAYRIDINWLDGYNGIDGNYDKQNDDEK